MPSRLSNGILFPSTNPPYIPNFMLNAKIDDTDAATETETQHSAKLVVCVGYRSTIDDVARHYTGFVYNLFRINPDGSTGAFVLPNQEIVSLDRLRLFGDQRRTIAQ